jgi:hypothetical protein
VVHLFGDDTTANLQSKVQSAQMVAVVVGGLLNNNNDAAARITPRAQRMMLLAIAVGLVVSKHKESIAKDASSM